MTTLRQKYKSIYWAWKSMKQRCLNPKCAAYHNYGGRGIGICDEWLEFEPFCEWALNNGWEKGLDLDRINNNEGYSPENCRFISRKRNINNRRMTTTLSIDGVERSISEWAEIAGMPCHKTIAYWINHHGEQYARERVSEAINHGYTPCDFSRNQRKRPIVCVNTGKRYESIKQAADELGLNTGNIVRAIRTGGTTGGYSFIEWREVA